MTLRKSSQKRRKRNAGRPRRSRQRVATLSPDKAKLASIDVVSLRSPRHGAPRQQGCADQASHRRTLNEPDIHRQRALDAYIAATFRWRIAIEKAESGD